MPKDRIAVPMLVRSDGEFRKNNLEIRHKCFKGESHLHWHDYYELEYIKSGSITYQYNGNSYTLSAGSAYLVTPSDYHNIIAYEAELYNIAFIDAQISRHFLVFLEKWMIGNARLICADYLSLSLANYFNVVYWCYVYRSTVWVNSVDNKISPAKNVVENVVALLDGAVIYDDFCVGGYKDCPIN